MKSAGCLGSRRRVERQPDCREALATSSSMVYWAQAIGGRRLRGRVEPQAARDAAGYCVDFRLRGDHCLNGAPESRGSPCPGISEISVPQLLNRHSPLGISHVTAVKRLKRSGFATARPYRGAVLEREAAGARRPGARPPQAGGRSPLRAATELAEVDTERIEHPVSENYAERVCGIPQVAGLMRVHGGFRGEGAPPCLARPPSTQ